MEPKKKISGYTIFMNRMLGQGAFGKVYIGEQDGTKLRVAIKALAKQTINRDPYIRSALFSEIQILKSLKSQNVVGFLDVMESDNYYYIVQEFCSGGDLKGIMDKRKRIPEAEAIGMLTQICNGFVELIREGIIHRDLKPENILVNNGLLKLADFGFSKRSNQQAKNQTMVGTPLYMSLQLLKGQPYTSKCDIWALGFIFYELLCGSTPWDGNSEYELITNIERRPLMFPPFVSNLSRDFITRCLKVGEKDRWSWDQLLKHEIFKGKFNQSDNGQGFENRFKALMRDLRLRIKSDNIDLERLWRKYGFNKQSEMKFADFERFMNYVSPNFTRDQIVYIFQRLDTDKSNSISYKEMEDELKRYNIPMQSAIKMPYERKQSDEKFDAKSIEEMQGRLYNGFVSLATRLDQQRTSLNTYFAQFDSGGTLKREELNAVLKNMGLSFTDKEAGYLFKAIDSDLSGTITFEEFYQFFCKVIGEPIQPLKPKGQQQIQQQQSYGFNPFAGFSQPMGQDNIYGGFQPDPLITMPFNMMMGGIQPMGMGGFGGLQQFPQQQPMFQQQMGQQAKNPNRRYPGMPAFMGDGWDY